MAATSRRTLMLAGAAIATAGASVPAPTDAGGGDAELLALCARHRELDALTMRFNEENRSSRRRSKEESEARCEWLDGHLDTVDEVIDALTDLTPRTWEGLVAKAAALALVLERDVPIWADSTVEESAEAHERLAYQFARQVAAFRWPGAAAAMPVIAPAALRIPPPLSEKPRPPLPPQPREG